MMKNKPTENMSRDLNSLFNELRSDLLSYIKNRFEYYKIDFIERISKIVSYLSVSLALIGIALSSFTFALFSLGFYFGNILNSNAAGFGVVALIWLVLLLLLYLFREPLKNYILNKCIGVLYRIQKERDDDDEEE